MPVKRKVEISQNFVAFSEYMNFNNCLSMAREQLSQMILNKGLVTKQQRIQDLDVGVHTKVPKDFAQKVSASYYPNLDGRCELT